LSLLVLLLLPFAAALAIALLESRSRTLPAWIAGATTLAGFALLLSLGDTVYDGERPTFTVEWVAQIGLHFSLRLDGLAFLFALLVLGIGALVVLYAAWYLSPSDPPQRFFAFLMLFMGAMLGVVLASNLLLLVVFWELTSLSSFLLIGFWQRDREARDGARMALAITGAGGLCLLGGVILLGQIVGSYELDVVLDQGAAIAADPLYLPTLILILLGAFTKSAQFPFHFWLPHAMAAPTPVSAYLHSATMVKAGVFLLARLYPALSGGEAWFFIVTTVGALTLLIGAVIAIGQQDLKGLLAYSTISHLGLITLLFGMGSPLAVVAGVFHILNHATFKASLFMAAGIIDHETGSRDFRKLNGLWKYMPITGVLAMTASLAMAGVPLLNGFLSKEMFFDTALDLESHKLYRYAVPAIALAASICAVAYSLRFIHDVFFNGEPVGLSKTPHEPPRSMRVPVELLVVLCLAVGLFPNLMIGELLATGAQATLNAPLPDYKLAIWHGFNLPLAFSAIGLVGGIVLYVILLNRVNLHVVELKPLGKRLFERALDALIAAACAFTRRLESGRLQDYLLYALIVIIAAGVGPFIGPAAYTLGAVADPAPPLLAWVIGGLAIIGAIGAVRYARQRVTALLFVGLCGLAVTIGFVALSAPDLALTQLLVEVVSVMLLLLALRYLPQVGAVEKMSLDTRWIHAAVAIAVGVGLSALTYAVLTRPSVSISNAFLAQTIPLGGGANAVNVIIVDFRAFDTLGEITVFAIAGLIIQALLASATLHPQLPLPATQTVERSLLLNVCAKLVLPLSIAISLHLFLRGHNLPGGGFIAALVLAIGVLLHALDVGMAQFNRQFRDLWYRWIGAGLLFAAITGMGSFLFEHPYLTSSTPYLPIPGIGEVPFASAMGFDTGVYFSVFGATVLLMLAIAGVREVRRVGGAR
jgi:multicomponent K+:H+ antiporter subunit A